MLTLKDIFQFSDPSFYAFHHSNADELQLTGAYYVCAGLHLRVFVEEGGGWHVFFPKCRRLQALSVTYYSRSIRLHRVTLFIYLSPPIC